MTQCLIVDESKTERDRILQLLSVYDFDLVEAHDAGEALQKCNAEMPDMIMMSERLAGMNAFDFINQVRNSKKGQEPVVLVYSERANPSLIGRAIWEGASECLQQPFDADVLDGKLRQVGLL